MQIPVWRKAGRSIRGDTGMRQKQTTGTLMLFITAMIWGSAFLAQQSGMDHIGPFTMQAMRYTLAGIVLLPFIAICDKT